MDSLEMGLVFLASQVGSKNLMIGCSRCSIVFNRLVLLQILGELASTKWRLRFGRKDVSETLGAVDPTGTYCAMPDDWLQKKLGECDIK